LVLHDGASARVAGAALEVSGGLEYDIFTIDIDGRGLPAPYDAPAAVSADGVDLPQVTDVTACAAPGCWRFDAGTKRLEVRVFALEGATRSVAVR
jgi:hypothetical protein